MLSMKIEVMRRRNVQMNEKLKEYLEKKEQLRKDAYEREKRIYL